MTEHGVDRASAAGGLGEASSPSVAFVTQLFDGDGATVDFTLSADPGALSALEAFISGVRQRPNTDYTFSGTTLTFLSAPASGTSNILARWGATVALNNVPDGAIGTVELVDSAVTTAKINDGAVTTPKIGAAAVTAAKLASSGLGLGFTLLNGYLDWTVSGNVLTVAVKTLAGADPSASDPVYIGFRDATAATGSPVVRTLTAATSIAINDTALLGTINSTAFRLWCVAFDDAGTVRLALINCLQTATTVPNIYPLAGWGIASSTAEGDGSDSAHVFYTDAAVTSKAYATLGYATWETGLATAGTWSAGPTRKQLFGLGVPLPGQIVQRQRTQTGAVATGTTIMPLDDTIPQNTEGDQYMSQAITPSSAANLLATAAQAFLANNFAGVHGIMIALFQDSVSDALATSDVVAAAQSYRVWLALNNVRLSGTTSSTTTKLRAGGGSAGTTTFNGSSGARLFGGNYNSYLEVTEIMA